MKTVARYRLNGELGVQSIRVHEGAEPFTVAFDEEDNLVVAAVIDTEPRELVERSFFLAVPGMTVQRSVALKMRFLNNLSTVDRENREYQLTHAFDLGTKPTFAELVAAAMAAFNALSPEDQRKHRREQAISWVRGEAQLARAERGQPDLTPDQLAELEESVGRMYDTKRGGI